jgi:hypothetical protein
MKQQVFVYDLYILLEERRKKTRFTVLKSFQVGASTQVYSIHLPLLTTNATSKGIFFCRSKINNQNIMNLVEIQK